MTVAYPINGNGTAHANGKPNGHTKIRRRTLKQRPGFVAWTFSFVARIATWGAILTILLRCPTSLEACDENSPFICKPYFRVKNAVIPRVQPYFDQYAAPYVDVAKPYYDTLNIHVLAPTRQYAVLYGTPLVNKGQDLARNQWELNGQPQLLRLQTLTKTHYDKSIAPHLAKAGEFVGPYYDLAQKQSTKAYSGYVLPGYELARPYAMRGYNVAADFTTTKALPATHWAWGKANAFLDTAVWPQLRVVYLENVEPQLVRIGERLARYRTKSKATSKVTPDESPIQVTSSVVSISSSFSKPPPQSSSTASTSTNAEDPVNSATESADATSGTYWNPVEAPAAAENESEKRKTAREMVANDLATWQNKFASQAEEGAGAMEDQVDDIARIMMKENALVNGKALLRELEDTITSEVVNLKQKIRTIVEGGGADAQQEAVSAIRSAGVVIKKKAQVIRGWREDYDAELQETVLDAADVYFQILDETRNLALQNIGMRWAWTDGVTYKDWQKYHELKSTLSNWTEELKQLIVTHPGLLEAQELSHEIEDDGMTLAATAAKELARLKEVSNWKILANDATINFDSDEMRLAAEAAQQTKTDAAEHEGISSDKADDIDEQGGDSAYDDASEIETSASEAKVEKEANSDPSLLSDELPEADTTIILAEPAVTVSLAEADKSPVIPGGAPSDASPSPALESGDDQEEEAAVGAGDENTVTSMEDTQASVTPAMFGAAAQSVADRSPILDEDTDSDVIASVTSAAQAAYSSAIALAADQYSSALSVVSAQVQGTSKPVHEQLFSSVSAAYGGAVSAASQKLNDAVAAASSGVYSAAPSPTKSSNLPDWQKVESIAAQRLNEGRLWAEIQYQSVLMALGAATPTPTSTPDKYYEQAKYQYYAGLGLAQDRYSSFMAAASSAWSGVTATPTPTDFAGSASSLASVAGKSAASVANAADGAAKSAYSAASEGVMSAAQDAQDTIEKAADAAAEQIVNVAGAVAGTWDNVVSQISADIYGQPSAIGWYEGATQTAGSVVAAATGAVADSAASASDAAGKHFEAINKIISELVVGKEPTFSESVMSRFSAVYATATSNVGSLASEAGVVAASVGDKIGSAASQATEVVKDSTQKVRDEL
ncbi:hypothetical protein QQS21_004489 [Conoideocrella luteorostrata]|uniref:Transcription factor hoxa13 n=1 Tax=Conoideocrella luteorostrata TaxID=1105319 RepID=A0AAJ0CRF6_9HYPO|nr:hypothetical protein QQS21_004489 [Conoideocrella luteorostrata]